MEASRACTFLQTDIWAALVEPRYPAATRPTSGTRPVLPISSLCAVCLVAFATFHSVSSGFTWYIAWFRSVLSGFVVIWFFFCVSLGFARFRFVSRRIAGFRSFSFEFARLRTVSLGFEWFRPVSRFGLCHNLWRWPKHIANGCSHEAVRSVATTLFLQIV